MKSTSDRARRALGLLVALAGAAAVVACSSDDSDVLSLRAQPPGGHAEPRSGSGAGSSGGTGATGGSGSSASGSGSGNTGVTDAGSGAPAPDASGPEALFDALLPSFASSCGPCHVTGSDNAPAYLGGSDPYATVHQYSGIVVSNPSASILFTKGQHEGPAMVDPLRTSVLDWLTAEAPDAAAAPVTTAAFAVQIGNNQVDLSSLVAGASLTFTAALTDDDELVLGSITLVAPATAGVEVVYPAVSIVPASGPPIVDDDLSNVDQTVAAGTSATLGPGVLQLEGWATGDQLRIAFKTLATSP